MDRKFEVSRKTGETDITLSINIDGSGKSNISTGVGFFDHMLNLFAKHGLFDLDVKAKGDLEIDAHHTVEDVGIVLGQAIKQALGEKKSIRRYGSSFVPMDEALVLVALDLSGRPYLVFDAELKCEKLGNMETELVEEFFRAVAFNAGITLHVKALYGSNTHHIIEAMFKAFGRALDDATRKDDRIEGVMSTKGML
ncbi:MAG TPA: imidazoleglycerol-phosphate dehydratase HisB [Hungateiclostridium thermocellum]|mgnify:CR=1 FL=1|uniref:Imidazoleglycerol-phosphate dehydratase n=2 Tax=Acetivibrio thermocellus TaxID=1515 RepID=HIS7_ACET2|nr:imidazoleglycerol-phosphate dehydratase HisB [Acetivibrio thermocellus]A3DJF3.1 RecName: Full=Imidazoleglycerol-phosphate dehydratase; Short=IGPD [Acetivibrio thermocellus ATCC 27405]CDG37375.1 Imidazoleglycerol-phosphate dehydratase [Acetivibrio thermocellus BC1]ABN54082.1 Imidazoleglycerol-phosphate dehydratase [Acetivibrio thermocellus ATCC 27405]ADU73514.1 Imidazoleglycerol-phosphate dehydratase [Acetivibrio thermocellus DSM 1313]ALX07436.1 Imidazoleglycerol-phosphate dehydratase [Aceti